MRQGETGRDYIKPWGVTVVIVVEIWNFKKMSKEKRRLNDVIARALSKSLLARVIKKKKKIGMT